MWSYEIENIITKERDIIFGYTEQDAFRRAKNLNRDEWVTINWTYED